MLSKLFSRWNIQRTVYCLVMLLFLVIENTNAQQTPVSYNRFQYHNYKWQTFHTSAFHIYFPYGYDSVCAFVARELPTITSRIKQRMITELSNEPNIIIYPSYDQLYETNIGANEPISYTLPTIVIKGNRIVIAYNGSYELLKQQLAEAVTRIIWEQQFENGIAEQLKGTINTNNKIPDWCKEGMINYFANGWTIQQEDQLQRSLEQQQFKDWYQIINYQPKLSGAAFCYYLTKAYYPQASLQLYQQLKKKKDFNRAIRLITKRNAQETLSECYAFYQQRFLSGKHIEVHYSTTNLTDAVFKHTKGILKKLEVSHDGKQVAYVIHNNKKRTIYTTDLTTFKTTKLIQYKLPPWLNDLSTDNYPLIKWSATKQELHIVYPEKGKLQLKTYTASGQKIQERILKYIDGVLSVENGNDDNEKILAAFRKGQSNILQYDLRREKYKAFTSDVFDDCQPINNPQNGTVFFTSKQQLKKECYNPQTDKDSLYWAQGIFNSNNLKPVVSDTVDYIQWKNLTVLKNGDLLATHTLFGQERFALLQLNGSYQTLSSYQPFSYPPATDQLHFYTTNNDSIKLKSVAFNEWWEQNKEQVNDTLTPWLKDYQNDASQRAKEDSILKSAKMNSEPVFLEGVLKPKNSKERSQQRKDSIYQSLRYNPERVQPYVLQLHSAYFSTKVNNDYFINRYQPYQNYQGQFKFPEVGGMAQGGFTDLFENHHINMGYRLPAGTEGSDFFVYYQNTKKKTDWGIKYFRKVESLQSDHQRKWEDENGNAYPNTAKVKTHYYELSFHHPLSYYASIDFNTAIRKDRTLFLATEKYSLNFAPLKAMWSINTLSYSYNKLQHTLPMLYKGFSGKALLDVFAGLQGIEENAVYGASINLQYHQPIYKYITAVASIKAGHSGGQQKILYNMGGVDNNLTVKTDTSVHFKQDAPYAFQTLITQLRGFQQNSLYGNQYALLNTDVYFPLFQTLIPIETNFSSINNLQLGLFTDVAYAKETWRARVESRTKVAYGFSVRTILAGYTIRVYASLPNENSKKVLWYLSVGG